jgi:YidC/Oxa1 family membrane protein insertase
MFNTLLNGPLDAVLVFLTNLTGNLGWAIILLTLIIKVILIPLTLPAMRSAIKMRDLKPDIDALKQKYKGDAQGLQQAQMALFKEHKINPATGCLPYLFQFIILIALYRVFNTYLNGSHPAINVNFLWLDLTKPDPYYILPIIAGVSQLVLSLMVLPAADPSAAKTLAAATKTNKDDSKADQMADMATSMQNQMVFLMPIMTVFFTLRFPSGLAIYWVVSTLVSIVQQYLVSGWGGLNRLNRFLKR